MSGLTIQPRNTFELNNSSGDVAHLCYSILSERKRLSNAICDLICEYMNIQGIDLLREYVNHPVDLTNYTVLQSYLMPGFQDLRSVGIISSLMERTYQVLPRSMVTNPGSPNYGRTFPMVAEILAFAMREARGKRVLEIAGASGVNCFAVVAGGADYAYLSELNKNELQIFESLRMGRIPKLLSTRLEAIEGDCFKILNKKPEIKNSIDLILCFNLIHFFSNEQQTEFMQLLKQILKSGGRAIFTANVVDDSPSFEKILNKNPYTTCFTVSQLFVNILQEGNWHQAILWRGASSCSQDLSLSDFTTAKSYCLYERNKDTQGKWKVYNDEYSKLDKETRVTVKNKIECVEMKRIKEGDIKILITKTRGYNETTLAKLFQNHGFIVERTFYVGKTGHLMNPESDENKNRVGIIVRYIQD